MSRTANKTAQSRSRKRRRPLRPRVFLPPVLRLSAPHARPARLPGCTGGGGSRQRLVCASEEERRGECPGERCPRRADRKSRCPAAPPGATTWPHVAASAKRVPSCGSGGQGSCGSFRGHSLACRMTRDRLLISRSRHHYFNAQTGTAWPAAAPSSNPASCGHGPWIVFRKHPSSWRPQDVVGLS